MIILMKLKKLCIKKLCIEKEDTSLYFSLYSHTWYSRKNNEIQKNFIYSIKNNKMKNIQY